MWFIGLSTFLWAVFSSLNCKFINSTAVSRTVKCMLRSRVYFCQFVMCFDGWLHTWKHWRMVRHWGSTWDIIPTWACFLWIGQPRALEEEYSGNPEFCESNSICPCSLWWKTIKTILPFEKSTFILDGILFHRNR